MIKTASALLVLASTAFAVFVRAQSTPQSALLALSKRGHTLAIVDPASLRVVGRLPAGPDPHEIIASADGTLAYISNYGGPDSDLHTITVVDLVAQKPLPAIDLGALRSAHGLAFAGGKLYFTVETNKAIGRYDPVTKSVDWFWELVRIARTWFGCPKAWSGLLPPMSTPEQSASSSEFLHPPAGSALRPADLRLDFVRRRAVRERHGK